MDDNPADDPLVFTPVPSRSTRTYGWTPERQQAFIADLARHGSVSAAARSVGMTPQTANRLRHRPGAEGFVRAWEAAIEEGRVRSRDEAFHRARHGWLSPITRDGELIGYRRRFDHRLLFAACYGRPTTRFARSSDSD